MSQGSMNHPAAYPCVSANAPFSPLLFPPFPILLLLLDSSTSSSSEPPVPHLPQSEQKAAALL
eukprot:3214137-Rhodomonas_salina.1